VDSLAISAVVFAAVLCGAITGFALRRRLSEQHLAPETKDVVKLGMGMVGTMTALVLGLLVASAKGTFDAQAAGITQLSANAGLLDRNLEHYGPDAAALRQALRQAIRDMLESYWPKDGSLSAANKPPSDLGTIMEGIQALAPKTDTQRNAQASAIKIAQDMGQTRWTMYAQQGNAVPLPFLGILIFWLAILFLSFSMFSRPNAVVVASLSVSALSMAAAVFLVLELGRPFDGFLRVSAAPLRQALEHLGG
jgi:hypothetical protein